MDKTIKVYDIELTPYCYIYGDFDILTEEYHFFVFSQFRDDRKALKEYFDEIISSRSFQFGFNNLDYDYPMNHYLLSLMKKKNFFDLTIIELLQLLNEKNSQLIPDDKKKKSNKYGKNYNRIYNPLIPQLDVFKILHWDNRSKSVSLKRAEINMRFHNVQEFDWKRFDKEKYTTEIEQELLDYNKNDIDATKELYYLIRGLLEHSTVNFPGKCTWYKEDKIDFRQLMGKRYNSNFLNHNDVKIGEEIGKITYLTNSGKTWDEIKNKKTFREKIFLKNIVPEYIRDNLKHKELLELLNIVDNTIIDVNNELQEDKKRQFNYSFNYANNIWSFGLGGIHTKDRPGIIEVQLNKELAELDGGLTVAHVKRIKLTGNSLELTLLKYNSDIILAELIIQV